MLVKAFTFVAAAIVSTLLIALVVLCAKYIVPKCCCSFFGKLIGFIKTKLMFNSVLRAFLQMYLLTCISIAISFQQVSFGDSLGATDFVLSLFLLALFLVLPYLIHRHLKKNQDKLPDKEFKAKYESAYQNMDYYKPSATKNTLLFLGRRFLFAFLVVVFLDFSIVFQVMLADILSTSLLGYYFCVLPMRDRLNNTIQILNELFVLISIWLMFMFTHYIEDPEQRYSYAWGWLYLMAIDIGFNVIVMFYVIGKKIYMAVKLYFAKRTAKKQVRARQALNEAKMKS